MSRASARAAAWPRLTISYYDIGYKTGEMAYDILANRADVSTMPIEYAPSHRQVQRHQLRGVDPHHPRGTNGRPIETENFLFKVLPARNFFSQVNPVKNQRKRGFPFPLFFDILFDDS